MSAKRKKLVSEKIESLQQSEYAELDIKLEVGTIFINNKKMKKKLLFLVPLLSLIFITCNDNNNEIENEGIIGKWRIQKRSEQKDNGTIRDLELSICNKNITLEFRNDETYTDTYDGGNHCNPQITEGKYSVNGNIITLLNMDGSQFKKIEHLESDKKIVYNERISEYTYTYLYSKE